MNLLRSIVKADYLQRTRSYAFLVTVLVSVYFAYLFLPAPGANYSTVRVGNFVGESNSAWIGHVSAIMASTFLWLIGFYLVNSGIQRDRETGVGQIMATTSISNFNYLLAKAFSNFLVLLTVMLIVMAMALVMVVIRSGNYPFDGVQFFFPYIFSTLPSIFVVSILAVVAEVALGRYSILQNIVFFILFSVLVGGINASNKSGLAAADVLGVKKLTDGMSALVNTDSAKPLEQVSVGFIIGNQFKKKYFLFEGSHWSTVFILSRVMWIGIGFIFLYISSRFFHRFDEKRSLVIKKVKTPKNLEGSEHRITKDISVSALPKASPSFGIWPFVKTEFLMLVRKGPKWFWLINLGVFISLFFIPIAKAHQIGLPVLWFLQINRWGDIATKEKLYRTHYFTYAAYKPLQRLLMAQVLAGVLLAGLLAVPIIFRQLIQVNFLTVFSIIIGSFFVISLSVFMGVLSGGKRLFEIVFFMLTYAIVSGGSILDYFGGFNRGIGYVMLMVGIVAGLLAVAFMYRGYEISHQ
jgi:hypothetical protein